MDTNMKCLLCGEEIKKDPLIAVDTVGPFRYAHSRCVPPCPKCKREIDPNGPYSKGWSRDCDSNGKPIIAHESCPILGD